MIENGYNAIPAWLQQLEFSGKSVRFTTNGHAWLRFHNWAFMRFPPHDVAPVSNSEKRELFFGARAVMLSHHRLPESGERANAYLYLCKDKFYDIDKLSANNRSKVRRGLKRLTVRRTTPDEMGREGYQCYFDACSRNSLTPISKDEFVAKWRKDQNPVSRELWAAFAGTEMAASGSVWICGKWAELLSTQSSNEFLSDYSNHALFFTILRDLLHREAIESVSYGLSSVQSNSKIESLHHFKLSVNLEAIPVVRTIEVSPLLKPAVNRVSFAGLNYLVRRYPRSRHLQSARGALEMMFGDKASNELPDQNGIQQLTPGDSLAFAELLREVFPNYVSSRLGLRFCQHLFSRYAAEERAFGFGFFENGSLLGFVVGGAASIHHDITHSLKWEALRAILFSHKTLSYRFKSDLVRRRLAAWKSRKQLKPDDHVRAKTTDEPRVADLVLIGITESARGKGVAGELLSAFSNAASENGFEQLRLVVQKDNDRARAAYEKNGWRSTRSSRDGVEYLKDLNRIEPGSVPSKTNDN